MVAPAPRIPPALPCPPADFDVWSPEIRSRYSQVYWTMMSPVPLPDDIIKRFDGKVIRFNVPSAQHAGLPLGQRGEGRGAPVKRVHLCACIRMGASPPTPPPFPLPPSSPRPPLALPSTCPPFPYYSLPVLPSV